MRNLSIAKYNLHSCSYLPTQSQIKCSKHTCKTSKIARLNTNEGANKSTSYLPPLADRIFKITVK